MPHSRTELAWPELRGAAPSRLRTPSPDLRRTLRFPAGPTSTGRSAAGEGAEEERRPAGVAGHDSALGRRQSAFFFIFCFFIFTIFNLPDKWAICPHQQAYFFFAMSALHVGPCCQFFHQFGINSKSVHIASNFKKKVIVFCDSNVKS
jgi:hypothetical protein